VNIAYSDARGANHTSQFSRIAQSPPTTDLSGGKASADSFIVRRSNLAVADAVDFQSNLLSPVAPGSLSLGRSTWT